MNPVFVEPQNMVNPGICINCAASPKSERKYFIDTGLQLDYFGAVYFCDSCLLSLVKLCPTAVELSDLTKAEQRIAELEQELMEAEQVYSMLQELGIDRKTLNQLGELSGRVNGNDGLGIVRTVEIPEESSLEQSVLPFELPDLQLR